MANLFNTSLKLYRLTIKRVRPLHRVTHRILSATVIPLLEKLRRFRTMPDDPFWFRVELLTDRHERETTTLLPDYVRPGMTVLDVGAHAGYYACRFARLVGQGGRVIAVEPHPRTFAILKDNVARFGNVTPVQAAAAEAEGTAELHDYLMMSASGSLHYDESMAELQKSHTAESDVAPRLSGEFAALTFTVRTLPLDALLAEHDIDRVDVVKMDIEGAEMGALAGLQTTIQNSPNLTLIMEYNPQALKAFDHVPQDALRAVMAMGFTRAHMIEPDSSLTDLGGAGEALNTVVLDALTERLMQRMDVVNLLLTC